MFVGHDIHFIIITPMKKAEESRKQLEYAHKGMQCAYWNASIQATCHLKKTCLTHHSPLKGVHSIPGQCFIFGTHTTDRQCHVSWHPNILTCRVLFASGERVTEHDQLCIAAVEIMWMFYQMAKTSVTPHLHIPNAYENATWLWRL